MPKSCSRLWLSRRWRMNRKLNKWGKKRKMIHLNCLRSLKTKKAKLKLPNLNLIERSRCSRRGTGKKVRVILKRIISLGHPSEELWLKKAAAKILAVPAVALGQVLLAHLLTAVNGRLNHHQTQPRVKKSHSSFVKWHRFKNQEKWSRSTKKFPNPLLKLVPRSLLLSLRNFFCLWENA